MYAVRWLLALLLLEALTHTLYFNAVARFGLPAWRAAAAAEPAAAAAAPAVTPVLAALTGWCADLPPGSRHPSLLLHITSYQVWVSCIVPVAAGYSHS